MTERYLEDLEPGQAFRSDSLHVDEESIKRFAAELDPRPFHLDEQAVAEAGAARGRAAGGGRGSRGAAVAVAAGAGFVKVRVTTLNQVNETVQIYIGNLVVPGCHGE